MQYWALTQQHYNWASNYSLWCMKQSCVCVCDWPAQGLSWNGRVRSFPQEADWAGSHQGPKVPVVQPCEWHCLPALPPCSLLLRDSAHAQTAVVSFKRILQWSEKRCMMWVVFMFAFRANMFHSLLVFTVLIWLHLRRRSTQGHLYAVQEKLLCSVQKTGKCFQKVRNRYAGTSHEYRSWMSVLGSN